MRRYLKMFRAFIRYKAQNELVYIGNYWSELASTTIYVITFIVFIDLLYGRVGSIGSFSKDDFLFMTLIGQFTFYFYAVVLYKAMEELINNVRTGAFDYALLRPMSTKFHTYASALSPVYGLFISVPNIVLFCFVINWSNISISLGNFMIGIVVWACLMLVLAMLLLVLTYPVFTQGDASDMLATSFSMFSVIEIPYDIIPSGFRYISYLLIPSLIATAGTAYIMLGKDGYTVPILLGSLIAAIFALICYKLIWNKAMQNYSSASS